MPTATMTVIAHAKVYDLAMDCTAHLENVYHVSYEMRENQIWTAAFELPITGDNDDKNQFCLDNHYVELFDITGTRIELFRIVSADSVRRRGELYMRYECEHALATLLDKELETEMNAGPGTGATITALLAMQDTAHWQLGTCDFARNFLHYWIPGTSLLAALRQISGRLYDETWQWTFDTTSYPWTLNLVEPGTDVVATIDYRLNMEEIKRTRGARKIVNRLYPRGNGAGVDELTIMSINITGAATTAAAEALPDQADVEVASAAGFAGGSHVYLENAAGEWEINDVASVAGPVLTMDNDLQHTYGIGSVCHIGAEFIEDATSQTANGVKSYPWKDERYTVAQNLYDAAVARLAILKDPQYTYTFKVVDLYPLIDEHEFQLGELVRIRDNELDILIDDRVTVLKKRDVTGKPQDIEVQASNKVPTFGDSMGNIIYADDLDGVSSGGYYSKVYTTQVLAGKILLSAVPGGLIGSMPNPPAAAGAYLSAEYIGIHNGTNWITYIDNAARLIADDGLGDASFRWDPTLIGAAKLQIKGTVSIEGGSGIGNLADAGALAVLNVIGNAYITDLAVDKLTAGDFTVGMNVDTGGYIQSSNYVYHTSGWKIFADGSAEFNNVYVRGTLNASDITAGTLNVARINVNSITPYHCSFFPTGAYLDLNNQAIFNCNTLRGGTGASTHYLDLDNAIWYGGSTTSYLGLTTSPYLRGQVDITLNAGNDIYLQAANELWLRVGGGAIFKIAEIVTNDSLSFDLGHEGFMRLTSGVVTRYVAFRTT